MNGSISKEISLLAIFPSSVIIIFILTESLVSLIYRLEERIKLYIRAETHLQTHPDQWFWDSMLQTQTFHRPLSHQLFPAGLLKWKGVKNCHQTNVLLAVVTFFPKTQCQTWWWCIWQAIRRRDVIPNNRIAPDGAVKSPFWVVFGFFFWVLFLS